MVGQGVLRECLLDPKITGILAVGRSSVGRREEKLREIVHGDLANIGALEGQLRGYEACFFCLGATAAGLKQEENAGP
jgi:hypothetical protein